MEGMRYLRENYNELKIKQYGGYTGSQNNYFLYIRNYYEEYIRKQNKKYSDMKQYYEEYIKSQNKKYLSMMKYYEELMHKQNDNYIILKKSYEEKLNYFSNFIDNNKNTYLSDIYHEENKNLYNEINSNSNTTNSKYNSYKSLEYTREYGYLKYKDNNLYEYNNLEKTYYHDEKDSVNKEVLKINKENNMKNDGNNFQSLYKERELEYLKEKELEEYEDSFIEDNKKEITKYRNSEELKENEQFLEEYKDIYVKFPIILAETNIAVTIDDTMKIGRDVKEIRRIKMNAFLKSSNLVPISLKNSEANSGMLFISGFIRKSIEYATRTYIEEGREDNSGYIKYCVVEVPFNFTTKITFIRPPVFVESHNLRENYSYDTTEIYNDDSISLCDNCNDNSISTEVFNQKPFVELVKANFIEFNIYKDLPLKEDEYIKERYTKLKGNIIINLRIRVLQEQDLRVKIEEKS